LVGQWPSYPGGAGALVLMVYYASYLKPNTARGGRQSRW